MEVTILMPCLNEVRTLPNCIRAAHSWLKKSNIIGEILIADNGSTDGSQQLSLEMGARVIFIPEKGYGSALMGGILNAKGKYVIMGDCDESYDFSQLDFFIEKLRDDYDLVMGNRFQGGIEKGAMPFLHRYLGNPALSFLGRTFFDSKIGDFHCGLRGFKQNICAKLDLQTTGMEFASEMIVKSLLLQISIAEVPTKLYRDGRNRRPHLRTWQDGWRHLRFLLMYSPTWLFKIPGTIFLVLGILLMLMTIIQPFEIMQGVFFDTNTLIFSTVFIILGYTTLLLGLFTRTFAREGGFLPPKQKSKNKFFSFSIERGILVGLLLMVAGLGTSFYAVYLWKTTGFGLLNPQRTLRIVVPGATLILLGCQTAFSSFFIGILKIKRKQSEVSR